ncbi:MAG: ATP-binding protein [Bacteroides sp.]|nr:ATP-binding protein [Bacteroides sp.]MCM1447733.1 ATP-binding protein [Bacteroides sp.]
MMDKRTLEIILSDQMDELLQRQSERFCRRKEEELIDLESTQAQVVIGVRRSGKSTLCYNALMGAGVKFAYVNFDDERLIHLKGEELNNVLEVLYKIYGSFQYLFIDEIQNIPEWYLFVNRLLRKQMHILITGSNAKLLSGELATHLTGRHHAIALYPFSFAEYCNLKQIDTRLQTTLAMAQRRAAFDEYLAQGGFPELQTISNGRDYIDGLVDNILQRDIEQRFKIVHRSAFEQLAHHLLNVAPAIIADKSLKEQFGFGSEHTVRNYVNYLCQAYLLLRVRKYSQKSRLRMTGEKIYPVDVALMNKRTDAFAKENLGWRLETIVYLELLRRCKPLGLDIYYYNERSGECDFVVCDNDRTVLAIQVSYDITNDKTRKREISGLLMVAQKTRCEQLLLLTDHQYEDIEEDGHTIAIRPVYDYVLQEQLAPIYL